MLITKHISITEQLFLNNHKCSHT